MFLLPKCDLAFDRDGLPASLKYPYRLVGVLASPRAGSSTWRP